MTGPHTLDGCDWCVHRLQVLAALDRYRDRLDNFEREMAYLKRENAQLRIRLGTHDIACKNTHDAIASAFHARLEQLSAQIGNLAGLLDTAFGKKGPQ